LTTFDILLSETARRQLFDLSEKQIDRLKNGLRELKENPFKKRAKADIKKLKGPKKDYFRLRIGNYRAVYVVEGNVVKVAKILPRDKAYDWLD